MSEVKEAEPEKIVEVVADKDYEDTEGMVGCLENGSIPHVITDDGKNGYEIEIPYEKSEADLTSTDPEELKKALHAGQIPEAPQKQSSLKGLGNPDLLVLFTNTVSHKMVRCALDEIDGKHTDVVRCHTSSGNALTGILENCFAN